MKKILSLVFIFTLLLSSVFAQGFSYGKPQAAICVSNVDDLLQKVEEFSTLFRFPMLKDQAKILLKSWIGTRDKTFIDTERKLAVLVYSAVELQEKSFAVVVPIKYTDELLTKLDNLFGLKIKKGEIIYPFPPVAFRLTDENIVISLNKELMEALTDEEVVNQLACIKPQSAFELQINLQEIIKGLLEQFPLTEMVEGQIEEVKSQMKGHPQEEIIVNWLDSFKGLVFSLIEGIDKIVVGGIDCKDSYGLSLRIDVVKGSKISDFFKKSSDKKMSLISAFPENYIFVAGSNVNVTPEVKEFTKGFFTLADTLVEAQFGPLMPPPAKSLIKKAIDLFIFSVENAGNQEAVALYEKSGKMFLMYGTNMNSSDEMVKKLEGILFGIKEMAKEALPPELLESLEGRAIGELNGKEAKAHISIPVEMLKQMLAEEREIKEIIDIEKLDKYFGEYIHIGFFDVPGFLLFGIGGDDLAKELETTYRAMLEPKKVLPHTVYVCYDIKKFLKKPFKLAIKESERQLEYDTQRLEEIKENGGDSWEERWVESSIKRKKQEIKTLNKLYKSFKESFKNGIKIREAYDVDEKGIKFTWAVSNEVLKDAGDLLAEFIILMMKQEFMREFYR